MATPKIEDVFSTDYSAKNSQIAHYSNIRSALTTFLITVALGCLTVHFGLDEESKKAAGMTLIYCTRTFLIVAFIVCLVFSYRTEKTVMKFKKIWNWAHGYEGDSYPIDYKPCWCCIRKRMLKDGMNWLLLATAGFIFYWTY